MTHGAGEFYSWKMYRLEGVTSYGNHNRQLHNTSLLNVPKPFKPIKRKFETKISQVVAHHLDKNLHSEKSVQAPLNKNTTLILEINLSTKSCSNTTSIQLRIYLLHEAKTMNLPPLLCHLQALSLNSIVCIVSDHISQERHPSECCHTQAIFPFKSLQFLSYLVSDSAKHGEIDRHLCHAQLGLDWSSACLPASG